MGYMLGLYSGRWGYIGVRGLGILGCRAKRLRIRSVEVKLVWLRVGKLREF